MDMRTRAGPARPPVIPQIVTLPAEIDLGNAGSVAEQLKTALRPGVTVVIGDMSATAFADTSAVRALLVAADAAAARDAELRLVIPARAVLRVLRVLGVAGMLQIFPSLGAALAARPRRQGGRAAAAASADGRGTTPAGPGGRGRFWPGPAAGP